MYCHQDRETLANFLSLLQSRQELLESPADALDNAMFTLSYANALLRRVALYSKQRTLPRQLLITGPTQSGKSTLVNLLLGTEAAEASPLAGYTRHPQGFVNTPVTESMYAEMEQLFPDWVRGSRCREETEQGRIYALDWLEQHQQFADQPAVVWDSPDFDSVSSRDYQESLPLVCAMADAICLVVSREKYADQSVWRLLRLISPLETPLLICLNKTSGSDRAALLQSLEQRLQEEEISYSSIVTLPYLNDEDTRLIETEAGMALREVAKDLLNDAPERIPSANLQALLQREWSQWTDPLRQELAAGSHWRHKVESALQEALELYERDYLRHPQYSDTLQRAILSLLELLEVPGAAKALVKTRQLLTWPARKLKGLISEQLDKRGSGQQDQETKILSETFDHLLLQLRHTTAEEVTAARGGTVDWWRNLSVGLTADQESIAASFNHEIELYQAEFTQEIEAAGRSLYSYLEDHPATLNSLRAARITADAAAVVLAIKTGGIGLNDFILTPAMLAFTSMLAEGAVGRRMQQVEQELKEKQRSAVASRLFEGVVVEQLLQLPQEMSHAGCYSISQEMLDAAEKSLYLKPAVVHFVDVIRL